MNRLGNEKSLYLQQHKLNPVHWYPWGNEAFNEAIKQDKPIFLSIGYSTCHWCHVMARESFQDDEIAKELNDHYISVKVDKEELPHIDKQYMLFVQIISGAGGWPSTLLLTPQLKPFFAGTYFPPRDSANSLGLLTILQKFAEKWKESKDAIANNAQELSNIVINLYSEQAVQEKTEEKFKQEVLYEALSFYDTSYDAINGGFEDAPKFPSPVILKFLVDMHYKGKELKKLLAKLSLFTTAQLSKMALEIGMKVQSEEMTDLRVVESLREKIRKSLEQSLLILQKSLGMAATTAVKFCGSGIYDHVEGGIHRYAVDKELTVPHFEKMLYDQAQMMTVLIDIYIATQNHFFLQQAFSILRYCEKTLKHPEIPMFGSGQNADSLDAESGDEVEGAYYVWTFKQLQTLLPDELFKDFNEKFEVYPDGNVSAEYFHVPNKNILRLKQPVPEPSSDSIMQCLEILKSFRQTKRTAPEVDFKCVTGWNAQMISCYAKLFIVTHDEKYRENGTEIAEFIFRNLYDVVSSKVVRGYEIQLEGSSHDYALLIAASLDLYEATFDPQWIEWAERLSDRLKSKFIQSDGSLLVSSKECTDIFVPLRDDFDGAELCANSVQASNFLRLALFTGDELYQEQALRIFHCFSTQLNSTPPALPAMLSALIRIFIPNKTVTILGKLEEAQTKSLIRMIQKEYYSSPAFTLICCDEDDFSSYLTERNPVIRKITEHYSTATEKPLIQICHDFQCYSCKPTFDDINRILKQ